MKNILKVICFISIILIPLKVYAETTKVKVSARIKYDGEYSEEVRIEAIEKLQEKALKKASSKFPKAKKKLIRQLKEEFYDDPDEWITEIQIQYEKNNEKKKILRLKAFVIVDLSEIQSRLEEEAVSAGGADSTIGVIAVVSRQTTIKEFKARQVEINAAEFQKQFEEKGGATNTSAISSTSGKGMSVKESGGSTTSKDAEEGWVFEADASMNAVSGFNEQLADLGFKPKGFTDLARVLEMDYTDIEKLTTDKGAIRGKHLIMFEDAAEERGWELFGYARIQLGKAVKNINEQYKVPAIVNFKVSENDDGWAELATVRPTEAYGTATDRLTARSLAINNAVAIAIKTVRAQLQQREVN